MKRTLLLLMSLIISISIVGCSDTSSTESKSSQSDSPSNSSSSISISSGGTLGGTSSNSSGIYTPFILNENSIYPTSFFMYESSLLYANWDENNKITTSDTISPNTFLKSSTNNDFMNYSSYTLTLVNNYIYFGDANNSNNLASINLADKTYNKLNNRNVHNITSFENSLFYLDFVNNDPHNSKLYSYDLNTKMEMQLSSCNIGKYILNGQFIIYQNLSDNSKLYRMNLDGSSNEKLTDFSVESFAPYSSELLVINSDDNNSLYVIDPSNLTPTRLDLLNGHDLESYNSKLYYINSLNYLCELKVNLTTSEVSSTYLTSYAINEYYPCDNYIIVQKQINSTTPYVLPIS